MPLSELTGPCEPASCNVCKYSDHLQPLRTGTACGFWPQGSTGLRRVRRQTWHCFGCHHSRERDRHASPTLCKGVWGPLSRHSVTPTVSTACCEWNSCPQVSSVAWSSFVIRVPFESGRSPHVSHSSPTTPSPTSALALALVPLLQPVCASSLLSLFDKAVLTRWA